MSTETSAAERVSGATPLAPEGAGAMRYAYCAVPLPFALAGEGIPAGIDGAPLAVVHAAGAAGAHLGALVSTLSGGEYERVTAGSTDREWLAVRAVAHDGVVTWASDMCAGSVVPFPMWTLFADDAAVATALAERADELSGALDAVRGAREYAVRIRATAGVVERDAGRIDPDLAALEARAASAPPGQAYLLRRKLDEARRTAVRRIVRSAAADTHAALAAIARRSAPARSDARASDSTILLDAAYLVPTERFDEFRAALSQQIARFEAAGIVFDFTGPWPPYHFVRGTG